MLLQAVAAAVLKCLGLHHSAWSGAHSSLLPQGPALVGVLLRCSNKRFCSNYRWNGNGRQPRSVEVRVVVRAAEGLPTTFLYFL